MKTIDKIGLGGGCHWCTEGVFQSLIGVSLVEQGWIASTGENDSLSEAVIAHFNPTIITLEILIEIHLLTHSSSSEHAMRNKYRSAVYTFGEEQSSVAEDFLQTQRSAGQTIVTQVLPYGKFKLNDEEFLNYFRTRPEAAFCERYVSPKLERLLTTHRDYFRG